MPLVAQAASLCLSVSITKKIEVLRLTAMGQGAGTRGRWQVARLEWQEGVRGRGRWQGLLGVGFPDFAGQVIGQMIDCLAAEGFS